MSGQASSNAPPRAGRTSPAGSAAARQRPKAKPAGEGAHPCRSCRQFQECLDLGRGRAAGACQTGPGFFVACRGGGAHRPACSPAQPAEPFTSCRPWPCICPHQQLFNSDTCQSSAWKSRWSVLQCPCNVPGPNLASRWLPCVGSWMQTELQRGACQRVHCEFKVSDMSVHYWAEGTECSLRLPRNKTEGDRIQVESALGTPRVGTGWGGGQC